MASYQFIAVVFSWVVSEKKSIGITVSYVGENLTEVPRSSFQNGVDVSDKINCLHLTNNSITRIPRGGFVKYKNLRYLHLDGNKLTDVSWVAFHRIAISVLNLSGINLQKCYSLPLRDHHYQYYI